MSKRNRRCKVCRGLGHAAEKCPNHQFVDTIQEFWKPHCWCARCGGRGHERLDHPEDASNTSTTDEG
jgi:hypothetical protein